MPKKLILALSLTEKPDYANIQSLIIKRILPGFISNKLKQFH